MATDLKSPYSHLPMIQKKLSQTKFVGITANCSDFQHATRFLTLEDTHGDHADRRNHTVLHGLRISCGPLCKWHATSYLVVNPLLTLYTIILVTTESVLHAW